MRPHLKLRSERRKRRQEKRAIREAGYAPLVTIFAMSAGTMRRGRRLAAVYFREKFRVEERDRLRADGVDGEVRYFRKHPVPRRYREWWIEQNSWLHPDDKEKPPWPEPK